MRHILSLLFLVAVLGSAEPAVAQQTITGGRVACTDGTAAGFSCQNVDLLSMLSVADLGGGPGVLLNDIWGWTDPQTGRQYAIVGRVDGTAFVDVTDPVNPVYAGELPLTEGARPNFWRDMKVYADHVFVVADGAGQHGMQVLDLRRLREVQRPPETFSETALYTEIASAHNIAINEATGYAYIVGARGGDSSTEICGGGLHMVDIRVPTQPVFAGCFTGVGYVHDVQCVAYEGPDTDYTGREICVASAAERLGIIDVTDKASPVLIAVATYPDVGYVHQGWFTEDQRYFLQDDELDEISGSVDRTRTVIWDLSDLDEPVVLTNYLGTTGSSDHNLYIVGDWAFLGNYQSGLRILDISDIAHPQEIGFFDTYVANDDPGFKGVWSTYPFFGNGIVVVSSREEGLFVVQPTGPVTLADEAYAPPAGFALRPAYPNPFNPATRVALDLDTAQPVEVAVYDALGRRVAQLHDGWLAAGSHPFTFAADHLPGGLYLVRAHGAGTTATRAVMLLK